ncbi:MAG: NPCBM/NEW2 domain-containing protein [Bacteroidota bacterium]|nr:NPCBM/NEW2 domain-containing protein [Bacteroidota bacterium]
MKPLIISFIFLSVISGLRAQSVNHVWLDDMHISSFSEGIPGVSVKTNAGGDSIKLQGIYYNRGIGVQSLSVLSFFLDGKANKFIAVVGADDKGNKVTSSKFYVIGDRKILFESGNMKPGDVSENVNIDLRGIKRLGLLVTISDSGARRVYSDWVNAQFEMQDNAIPKPMPNDGKKYILTPQPAKFPRINSASIFGATPGNPFFYTIAATGERPMQFTVKKLPKGLSLDPVTGIITGVVNKRGTYVLTMEAFNKMGRTAKQLIIKIGDTIALTPPIGWNGWNSWAKNIDKDKVIASANAMVSSGLSNHGWTYINVDDAWQGLRGGKYHAIQPNDKFPRFKTMIDYIHSKGLKFGVYSTPWISSYAGYVGGSSNFKDGAYPDSIRENKRAYRYIGKYRFEKNDALQMADWGVDYLKYDWHIELSSAERMSEALRHSGRDIFYSLSNSAPFALAKDWERIANAWRTGPDIRDSWLSLYVSAFTIDKWAPYAGPGHWNDPDMLILGNVTTGSKLHPTRLTPDEQYSHVSIFSLLSAPLIIGCPIEKLDAFTLNLLSNDEVIAVDQDPLGKPARLLLDENDVQVWLKPLHDGSYAVGLFNIDGYGATPQSYFHWGDEKARSFEFDFNNIGLKGKWKLRDVWKQKDLGEFDGIYKTYIRHHGVVMLRMFSIK